MATLEEKRLALKRLRLKRAREMSHPITAPPLEAALRSEAASVFGVPPEIVDFGMPTAEPVQRFAEGVLADTPAESAAFYGGMDPAGRYRQVGEFVGRQPIGGGPVQFTNLPGMDLGDVAQFAGGAAVPVATGAAAAFTRNPLAANLVAQPLTELAREGAQGLFGTQRESPAQYGTRAGLAAATELLVPGFSRGLSAIRSRFGRQNIPLEMSEDELANAVMMAAEGFDTPALMNYQRWGRENPVLERMSKQILQLTGAERSKVISQLEGLKGAYDAALGRTLPAEELPSGFIGPPQALSPDMVMQRALASQYESRLGQLRPRAQPRQAGRAVQRQVEQGIEARRANMRKQYDLLDQFAAEENPIFDISRTRSLARNRVVEGIGIPKEEVGLIQDLSGNPITSERVRGYVNVAKPQDKLARIYRLVSELDPRQEKYEVVKELRSQVGSLLNMPYAQRLESGIDLGQVKQLYEALSGDMMPVDPTQAPRFAQQQPVAIAAARDFHDTFNQKQVGEVLTSIEQQVPEEAWKALRERPVSWAQSFREVLKEGDPQQLDVVRRNLDTAIRRSNDPVATLRQFEEDAPEALDWLYPTKKAKDQVLRTAREINEVQSTLGARAYDMLSEERGFARYALEERLKTVRPNESPTAAAARLARESGPQGQQALRNAAISSALENSIKLNERYGEFGIEPASFRQGIEDLKTRGWWDGVLTPRDRDYLTRLAKLSDKIWEKGDAGTALTVAAQVSGLRGGEGLSGVMESAAAIRLAHLMSHVVTATNSPKDVLLGFIPRGKAKLGDGKFAKGISWLNRSLRQYYPTPQDETTGSAAAAP